MGVQFLRLYACDDECVVIRHLVIIYTTHIQMLEVETLAILLELGHSGNLPKGIIDLLHQIVRDISATRSRI